MIVIIKRGFTLLEIVIVLAIASIIVTIVFFSIFGAQRAQRDSNRRDYAQRALGKIQEFRGNNSGNSSAMTSSDMALYMNDRKINNITPTIIQDASIPSGTCVSGGVSGAVFQFSGGATAFQEYVAVCLEVEQWYVIQSQ